MLQYMRPGETRRSYAVSNGFHACKGSSAERSLYQRADRPPSLVRRDSQSVKSVVRSFLNRPARSIADSPRAQ